MSRTSRANQINNNLMNKIRTKMKMKTNKNTIK